MGSDTVFLAGVQKRGLFGGGGSFGGENRFDVDSSGSVVNRTPFNSFIAKSVLDNWPRREESSSYARNSTNRK